MHSRSSWRLLRVTMLVLLVSSGESLREPSPALASHVVREVVPIAVGAGGQFDPSIKVNQIAYTDTSIAANGADVVVHNITTGAKTRISATGGAQEVADVDGNFVVYQQFNVGDGDNEIFVHNLTTNAATQITNDSHLQFDSAISGTRIVWTQVENAGTASESSTIWMANVDGSGVQAISAGGDQITPAIDGNTVVWREDSSIVAFDLLTFTKTTIAASGVSPDVRGTKIVYASGGNIFLFEGGTTTQITSDAAGQRNPKVSAELLAWEHVVSGTDVDVVAYDFRTTPPVIETIAGGAGLQQLHDLDGTNLAFTDFSTDATGDVKLVREVVVSVSPQDAIADLIEDIEGLGQLNKGQQNSLIVKLEAALNSIENGKLNAACGQLGAFINEVNALVRSGKLDAATGTALIAAGDDVRTAIGCA